MREIVFPIPNILYTPFGPVCTQECRQIYLGKARCGLPCLCPLMLWRPSVVGPEYDPARNTGVIKPWFELRPKHNLDQTIWTSWRGNVIHGNYPVL